MFTTADYLEQLIKDKKQLAENLIAKGIEASESETFTSLVPKINDIDDGTLNVFAQKDEPSKKDGIWIKTIENEINYEGVKNFIFDFINEISNIPYDFSHGNVVAVGTDVYLLGSSTSAYAKYTYKYDTLTDTYTKLTDIPYDFSYGNVVAVGTDVYLLGSSTSAYAKYTYKYDTLTDTYTKLADIPYNFSRGGSTIVDNNIYLFSGNTSSVRNYAYKYNILTDAYVRLTNIPNDSYLDTAVAIGTDIYLIRKRSRFN